MSDPDSPQKSLTELEPTIEWVPLGPLTAYAVSADELEELKRGSSSSLFFNFAIFCLSTAISFTLSLSTAEIKSDRLFTVFVVITVLGYLAGFVLLALWWFHHRSASSVIERIEKRRTQRGIPATAAGNIPTD